MNKKILHQDHISYNSNIQKNPYSWNHYFNLNDKSPNKKSLISQRSPSPKLLNISPIKCIYKKNSSNEKQIDKSKSLKKGLFQLQIQKTNKQNSPYEMNFAPQIKVQKKIQFGEAKNNMFTQLIKKIQTNNKRQTSIQSTCSQKIGTKRSDKQVKNDSGILKFKKGQTLCFKNINGNKQNIKDQSIISTKETTNYVSINQYQLQQNKISTLSINSNVSTNKLIQFKNNISKSKFIKKQKSYQKFSDLPTVSTLTNISTNSYITNSNLDLKKCNSNKLETNCSIKIVGDKSSIQSSLDQVNMSREQNEDQLDMSPYFV